MGRDWQERLWSSLDITDVGGLIDMFDGMGLWILLIIMVVIWYFNRTPISRIRR
jgi:hypothetical protein